MGAPNRPDLGASFFRVGQPARHAARRGALRQLPELAGVVAQAGPAAADAVAAAAGPAAPRVYQEPGNDASP